jgi:transcriptional regulator with XRE-family HTH domain
MSCVRRYCRCGSLLARDNAGSLCSVCAGTRPRNRAPDVPTEFWHTAAMAAALASGDLGRVIRAYRSHPYHGHRPLPQALVADWLHVSQTTLSRIELGRRRLTLDEISGFSRALGISIAVRWSPQHEAGEDVDPLSRRSLLGAGVGAAVGLSATTAPAAAREIDPALVAHWMKLLRVLGRHDAMFGPHDVLGPVRHSLDLIAGHTQIARGDLRTQLLHVESRWAWFASWLSNDAGDWRRRDFWTDRASRLAQEVGDYDMVAWVLMWQSRWAATQHDARRAIVLADAARSTRGTTDKIRGLCALKQAHGHALANDSASCERSLADAYGLLDHGAQSDHLTLWDDLGRKDDGAPPYVLADEARCWLRLRPHQAAAMLEDVLLAWPRDRIRGRGIHQARLALACAAADEPERAAAEGIKALDIAQITRSDIIVRELKQLNQQLASCDVPEAADFREAFSAL